MDENKTIYKCAECGEETDYSRYASTQCSECKKSFCFSMDQKCFINHHIKTKCIGSFQSITNPQWILNLMRTMVKDEIL